MNRKALFFALAISAIVSMALWSRIRKSQETINESGKSNIQQVSVSKEPAVISKKKIPARTRLDNAILSSSFEIKKLDKNIIPSDAFSSLASMTNRYTSVTILPGDVMTPLRLLTEEQIPSLALAIPKGKRAISLTVSEATSVGGFIQQGDYVDIIATFRTRGKETTTKLILQDIQVLAVGTTYEFDGNIATSSLAISANKAKLVTLALTPQDTEKLMFLDSGISFRLILKNPNDHGTTINTLGITEKQLMEDLGISEPSQEKSFSYANEVVTTPPLDNGSVVIMQGAYSKREISRYNGPVGFQYNEAPIMPSETFYSNKQLDLKNKDQEDIDPCAL